jgi:hypothetical protein
LAFQSIAWSAEKNLKWLTFKSHSIMDTALPGFASRMHNSYAWKRDETVSRNLLTWSFSSTLSHKELTGSSLLL